MNNLASRIRPIRVARDVLVVFGLTFAAGYVVGFMFSGDEQAVRRGVALADLVFSAIAFFVVGALSPDRRWRQIAVVAFVVWIVGLLNVVFMNVPFGRWINSLIGVCITAAVGGGLSVLLQRDRYHPAGDEIARLERQVERLSAQVEKLGEGRDPGE